MIVYDLVCEDGHRFEGWFASSDDFTTQVENGMVSCPFCGSALIEKAPMAPAVPRKGNQVAQAQPHQTMVSARMPSNAVKILNRVAQLQADALKDSRWVGQNFAEHSREMHYGEREMETIHGQATLDQAKELLDEGVPVMPLLVPITAPEDLN